MAEPAYEPTDRRPIAARQRPIFQRMAKRLAARGVSANAISIWGMIAAVVAGAALWATSQWPAAGRVLLIVAAIGMQLRLLANMIDGMVAIESGKASRVGEIYNEAPDRVSDAAVFIGAGYAVGSHVALGYIASCVALFVAYIRTLGKAAGAHNEFCGPMAKQQRMAVMTVASLLVALLPSAWQPVMTVGDTAVSLMALGLLIVIVGGVITAIRRLRIIVNALRNKPA